MQFQIDSEKQRFDSMNLFFRSVAQEPKWLVAIANTMQMDSYPLSIKHSTRACLYILICNDHLNIFNFERIVLDEFRNVCRDLGHIYKPYI